MVLFRPEKWYRGSGKPCRCLARELKKLGVEVTLSSDPHDLDGQDWDVIHTHGSSVKVIPWIRAKFSKRFRIMALP